MKENFETIDVVAAAVAALEVNNQRVERYNSHEDNADSVKVVANRRLMEEFLTAGTGLAVTEDHRKRAEEVVEYLQQTSMLRTLTGQNEDQFLNNINSYLAKPDLRVKDFGFVAWAPKVYNDYKNKDSIREVSALYERTSRYVGAVGKATQIDFKLIEQRYRPSIGCWLVFGVTSDGNLVKYWANNPKKIVESGKLSVRVKSQKVDDRCGNARVTVLNYVKVIN